MSKACCGYCTVSPSGDSGILVVVVVVVVVKL